MSSSYLELYPTFGLFASSSSTAAVDKIADVFVDDVRLFEPIAAAYHFSSLVSHEVVRVHLPESEQIWFQKEILSPVLAKREVLAQELFRLYLPKQPVTKLAYHPETRVYYVLSQEVKGFKPLADDCSASFADGTFNGLGSIMMLAYFLQEADLKNGNVGLGEDNILYKIDGDWAFASLRDERQYPPHTVRISSYQINHLPFLNSYRTHNWFDIVAEGKLRSKSRLFERGLASNPHVLHEKFMMMSQILLTPHSLFEKMVEGFFPGGSKPYLDLLFERQASLMRDSMNVPAFKDYFLEHYQQIAKEINAAAQTFKLQGEDDLFSSIEFESYLKEAAAWQQKIVSALGLQESVVLLRPVSS